MKKEQETKVTEDVKRIIAQGACAIGEGAKCPCWDHDEDVCHGYDCEHFVGLDDESEELHEIEMAHKETKLGEPRIQGVVYGDMVWDK